MMLEFILGNDEQAEVKDADAKDTRSLANSTHHIKHRQYHSLSSLICSSALDHCRRLDHCRHYSQSLSLSYTRRHHRHWHTTIHTQPVARNRHHMDGLLERRALHQHHENVRRNFGRSEQSFTRFTVLSSARSSVHLPRLISSVLWSVRLPARPPVLPLHLRPPTIPPVPNSPPPVFSYVRLHIPACFLTSIHHHHHQPLQCSERRMGFQ